MCLSLFSSRRRLPSLPSTAGLKWRRQLSLAAILVTRVQPYRAVVLVLGPVRMGYMFTIIKKAILRSLVVTYVRSAVSIVARLVPLLGRYRKKLLPLKQFIGQLARPSQFSR